MKQYAFPMIASILISACCSYDRKDFDFSSKEQKHFAGYKVGDTLYFQSNLGDVDTITVAGFGTEVNEKCGGIMARPPVNGKWIQIRHLPSDQWHGTSQDMTTGGQVEIVYQELFWITKQPEDKTTTYTLHFKDFYSRSDTTIGEYHKEPLQLNDLSFEDYYVAIHGYPERIIEPENIETVYWTDKHGLTAYKNHGGEVWTKKIAVGLAGQ